MPAGSVSTPRAQLLPPHSHTAAHDKDHLQLHQLVRIAGQCSLQTGQQGPSRIPAAGGVLVPTLLDVDNKQLVQGAQGVLPQLVGLPLQVNSPSSGEALHEAEGVLAQPARSVLTSCSNASMMLRTFMLDRSDGFCATEASQAHLLLVHHRRCQAFVGALPMAKRAGRLRSVPWQRQIAWCRMLQHCQQSARPHPQEELLGPCPGIQSSVAAPLGHCKCYPPLCHHSSTPLCTVTRLREKCC